MNLKERILYAASGDWLYLAEIVSYVCKYSGINSEHEAIEPTLKIIEEMVTEGLLEIGDLSTGVFKAWDSSLVESLAMIKIKWSNLGRELNISDVCWLANTPKGDEIAATIVEDEPDED